jgi:hypothetical protein
MEGAPSGFSLTIVSFFNCPLCGEMAENYGDDGWFCPSCISGVIETPGGTRDYSKDDPVDKQALQEGQEV